IPGEDDDWELGTGAGFYVDATQEPWKKNYNMYSYVQNELQRVVAESFAVDTSRTSIFGHSMGGHGALVLALRNPGHYKSVSAFAPICHPSTSNWGRKQFAEYLGSNESTWAAYDATELVKRYDGPMLPVLVDQGDADQFYSSKQLQPSHLVIATESSKRPVQLDSRMQPGYDHSYYFIQASALLWRTKRANTGAKVNCSENQASLLSRIFFCWITPLVVHGWATPVELNKLPEIGIGSELDPSTIAAAFQREWAREGRRVAAVRTRRARSIAASQPNFSLMRRGYYGTRAWLTGIAAPLPPTRAEPMKLSPSLIRTLYPLVAKYLIRALVARVVAEIAPVFIPILVKLATTYAQHKRSALQHAPSAGPMAQNVTGGPHVLAHGPPNWQGYILALGIFLMLLLSSWTFQWFYFEIGKAVIIVRTALVSAVYRKSLLLSSQARSRLTLGRLTNLISSDVGQIERGVTLMLFCITIPLQVVASAVVLVYIIGPVGISGWALVVAFVPVQMWVSRYLVTLRKQAVRYTDKRIRATRESLQGIRVVKFFVWEDSILENVQRIRSKEVAFIAKLNLARYGLMSLALHSPVFASIITFGILVAFGGKLKTGPVFAVIGIFNAMSVPLSWLPGALTETRNSAVPLQRITQALLEEELDPALPCQPNLDVAIRLDNARFVWKYDASVSQPDMGGFGLDAISIEIPHGCLVAVVGAVGSGKSSLASALVGEMKRVSGTMAFGGSLSYAPQVPWVTNSSIRDNITFGLPLDKERYINVVEACALDVDLAALPAGDLTEIGERGTTLSGGQKQRVSIARAAYSESDIVLLDDCLSAVDVKVSRLIFKHCIKGVLSQKTRILVTNSLDYLPAVDFIITMENGRIVEHGSFANLMCLNGITASMFDSFVGGSNSEARKASKGLYTTDSSLHTASPIKATASHRNSSEAIEHTSGYAGALESSSAFVATETGTSTFDFASSLDSRQSTNSSNMECMASHDAQNTRGCAIELTDLTKKRKHAIAADPLMSQEDRQTGQISLVSYKAFIRAGGGYLLFTGIVACLAISQACRVGSDFWMRHWIQHKHDIDSKHVYMWIYVLLGGLQFLWFGLFALLLVVSSFMCSKALHGQALRRVLRAPMSFFDTTPLGRILNRFTRDVDSLDLALCDLFRQFYQNIARSIGSFVSISILVPIFLAPLIPLVAVSWVLIYVYLRTSVEVQRVAAIARSPLYAHYAETLQGLVTIRVHAAQSRYIERIDQALDDANRPQWYALVTQNWVWLRIDYLSHLLSLTICLIIVSQPTRWDAAAVGLLLVQATQMGAYVTYAGRGWTELQNNMNSVERINHYATELDQESSLASIKEADKAVISFVPTRFAPAAWPERGTIIIRDLFMSYRQGLPFALNGISMEIYSQERIGVVGRSGAGKSSIITALFRLVEPSSGKIFIDGVDTQSLDLSRLRRAIGILPQDPVLFCGTLRENLDHFYEFSDTEIWDVLDQVCLRETVALQLEKLDMPVSEGGENFSLGQRQLVCLARVLLRQPKILVLDEATANVDHETDNAIQQIVLSSVQKMTVISIAHRLQTVASYDRVFVIDDGQVVESGTPLELLERHLPRRESEESIHARHEQPSAFYNMVKQMDSDAIEFMLAQARAAEASKRGAMWH
ncbi:hypothetical protein GGI18_000518, partial [Coemansia linderi]